MPGIKDITIINSNTAPSRPFEAGTEKVICSKELCGANNLTVYKRTVAKGKQYDVKTGAEYHLVYVLKTPADATITYRNQAHKAEEGSGVLLAPSESAKFEAKGSDLELLYMVVPKPPAAVDAGLDGGPGYYFNRETLRRLTDNSGGRIRRFCAESTVRLRDGRRLTQTNAIQAGEMHYVEGGSSPYHLHTGTEANPEGPNHVYMTFKGYGKVEVGEESQVIEPGTLVYFPPNVPHRLRSHNGALDYFEIQAWRSFKTKVLSTEELGLRWYYDPEKPGQQGAEWDQS